MGSRSSAQPRHRPLRETRVAAAPRAQPYAVTEVVSRMRRSESARKSWLRGGPAKLMLVTCALIGAWSANAIASQVRLPRAVP